MDKVGIAAITIGAGVVVAVLAIKPVTYNSAMSLFENGKYEEAIGKFEQIGNYQDSQQYCQYGKALVGIEEGNYSVAVSLLAELGDFKDADELEKYYQAVIYEDKGDYESLVAAKDLYDSVASYSDSEQRSVAVETAIEEMYQDGVNKIAEGKYEEGYAALQEMGDYGDAQNLITSNMYERGMAALEVDDFESAMSLFGEIEDYLDSKEQMLAAKYVAAEYSIQINKPFVLNDVKDQEIKDILTHATDYIYTQEIIEQLLERAEARLETKDFYHAKAMLLAAKHGMEVVDVPDEEKERWSEDEHYCDYLNGLQLIADGEYEAGYGMLNLLMDYRDAREQIAKSQYERAAVALEQEEYDQSIKLFQDAGDYEDAKEQVKVATCQKAAALIKGENYREAYKLLEELGEYPAATELLLKSKEERGVLAVEEKIEESCFYVISDGSEEKELWEMIPLYKDNTIDFKQKLLFDAGDSPMDYFIDEVVDQTANMTVLTGDVLENEIKASYDSESGVLTMDNWKYAQQDYIADYAKSLMDIEKYDEALAVYEMLEESSKDDEQKNAIYKKCVIEARYAVASNKVTDNKYEEKIDTSLLLGGEEKKLPTLKENN